MSHYIKIIFLYIYSGVCSLFLKRKFWNINTFCMFIGTPRSGHTLVASIINKHPKAAISIELDVLFFLKRRFSQYQIFALILRNVSHFLKKGEKWTSYSYKTTYNEHNKSDLILIGDKLAGKTVQQFREQAQIFELLNQIKYPITFIHVIRNPYDNIATIAKNRAKNKKPEDFIDIAIDYYESNLNWISNDSRLAKFKVIRVYLEDIVNFREIELTRIFNELNLEIIPEFIDSCCDLIFTSPKLSRNSVEFNEGQKGKIDNMINSIQFLNRYR